MNKSESVVTRDAATWFLIITCVAKASVELYRLHFVMRYPDLFPTVIFSFEIAGSILAFKSRKWSLICLFVYVLFTASSMGLSIIDANSQIILEQLTNAIIVNLLLPTALIWKIYSHRSGPAMFPWLSQLELRDRFELLRLSISTVVLVSGWLAIPYIQGQFAVRAENIKYQRQLAEDVIAFSERAQRQYVELVRFGMYPQKISKKQLADWEAQVFSRNEQSNLLTLNLLLRFNKNSLPYNKFVALNRYYGQLFSTTINNIRENKPPSEIDAKKESERISTCAISVIEAMRAELNIPLLWNDAPHSSCDEYLKKSG